MDLSQAKHAFITGGASGIGLGIAHALANRDISVTLADIDSEALAAVVGDERGRFRGQVLDTRDRQGWAAAKTEAEHALGPVDIVVNNAGIGPEGRELADMDPQSFERILAINLVGVFNGVSAFAADMRARRRGHIVNTASMAGLTPLRVPRLGDYAVSKFGVVALSEVLRVEMAPYDVGVSALCPGFVVTNLRRTTAKLGGRLKLPDANTLPRSGVSAADVGDMVVQGIAQNSAYIITHPDGWPGVEERMHAIEAAFASTSL